MDGMSMKRRGNELGDILFEAREAKGLSLDDLVELTDVRRSYLLALESGHYAELSEASYAKKALRLYAQAVGLDVTRMLHIFRQEQRRAAQTEVDAPKAASTAYSAFEMEEDGSEDEGFYEVERTSSPRRATGPVISAFGRFATTLMLVVGVVVLALWGFNALLFGPTPSTQAAPESEALVATAPAGASTDPVRPDVASASAPAGLILLSVNTTPPGANVSVDGLPFDAVSPVTDAPVRAGARRTVRVSMAGYGSVEQTIDLTRSRNLNISLSPAVGAVDPAEETAGVAGGLTAPNAANTASAPGETAATSARGTAVFVVGAPAWLEVYAGPARGEGERLYYGTAEAGETLTFDLPVYVHTGNGGGVSLAVDGEDRGTLGADGQVTGRALP